MTFTRKSCTLVQESVANAQIIPWIFNRLRGTQKSLLFFFFRIFLFSCSIIIRTFLKFFYCVCEVRFVLLSFLAFSQLDSMPIKFSGERTSSNNLKKVILHFVYFRRFSIFLSFELSNSIARTTHRFNCIENKSHFAFQLFYQFPGLHVLVTLHSDRSTLIANACFEYLSLRSAFRINSSVCTYSSSLDVIELDIHRPKIYFWINACYPWRIFFIHK